MMKKITILFTMLMSTQCIISQEFIFENEKDKNNQEFIFGNTIENFFTAIIVTDIVASKKWYESTFGCKALDFREYEDIGLKQSNLKFGNFHLELIELKSALDLKKEIKNYNEKTKVIGFFKIGLKVNNFDELLSKFQENKIRFHGKVVKDPIGNKRTIVILDPDGNRIQIFEI